MRIEHKNANIKKQGNAHPDSAPDKSLSNADCLAFPAEKLEVNNKHGQDGQRED
jgi:hypothetical protein